VQALHIRYLSTRQAMQALSGSAALAAQAAAAAVRGYELGEHDLARVALARREAIEAEGALLEAEHAHAAAKIELFVAAGRVPR
jgi:cobalt-zinc-cadmium efflux system outer membrane protein